VRLKILDVVLRGCWRTHASPQIRLRGSLEAQQNSLRNDGRLVCRVKSLKCRMGSFGDLKSKELKDAAADQAGTCLSTVNRLQPTIIRCC
jgi:hypothetical protein